MEKKFFYQPVKHVQKHENIRKIATSQRDEYITGCLLDYSYLKKIHRIIAIDLSE